MNLIKKTDRLFRDFILYAFDLIKYIPLKLIDLLPSSANPDNYCKEIFLIKVDEIGDYILFRNFLSFIKKSGQYKEFKVTLCGNAVWKNIAENLDENFVDEYIWLDKNLFLCKLFYRYKFLKMIAQRNPQVAVNCSYSRSFYIDDTIISVIKSNTKIGFKTDLSNSYKWQINLSDNYYTRLINTEDEIFDFYKNRNFFEKIFNERISLNKPFIENETVNSGVHIEGSYAVFFIGGRRNYKRWPLDNFVRLGEYLVQNYNLRIVLSGSFTEIGINRKFFNKINFKGSVMDLAGKTSLIDLLKVLSSAKFLVSNDSGIVHAAASLDKLVLVLANGTHFGRFLPYPDSICSKINVVYPQEMSAKSKEKNYPSKNIEYRSIYDISNISFETIKKEVDRLSREI